MNVPFEFPIVDLMNVPFEFPPFEFPLGAPSAARCQLLPLRCGHSEISTSTDEPSPERSAESEQFWRSCSPLTALGRWPDLSEAERSTLHAEVARRVERGGDFWISTTELKGHTWFRLNPVNFRTRLEHMDALLEVLTRECAMVASGILSSAAIAPLR